MAIITYNGTEAEVNDCRKIMKQYYKIGDPNIKGSGQCYQLDGVFYRETSPKIAWDAQLKKYNLIENMLQGWTEEGELGYFSANGFDMYWADNDLYVQNEDAVKACRLVYDFGKGYYTNSQPTRNKISQLGSKPTYKTLRTDVYSMSDYPIGNIVEAFKQQTFDESVFDKYLFNYKMGLEIETDMGYLPENLYYKMGCVPLKDGSITGTEITTVLYPAKMRAYEKLFDYCSRFTSASHNNSLHVNLSGFKNSAEFRVALYILYYRIQQEILQFTPIYKRSLAYFTSKQGGPKDHCKPMESLGIVRRYDENTLIKDLKEADIAIFKFLNNGIYNSDFNLDTRRHIKDGGHKWDMSNRYYALNLLPLYFGNIESSRVEFRIHSGTVNKYKAVSWIYICTAIINFVEKNAKRILLGKDKITLDDILQESFDNSSEGSFLYHYLQEYIRERTEKNMRYVVKGVDENPYGDEFMVDNTFLFEIRKKSLFNFESKK